jgi:hypothetical protein
LVQCTEPYHQPISDEANAFKQAKQNRQLFFPVAIVLFCAEVFSIHGDLFLHVRSGPSIAVRFESVGQSDFIHTCGFFWGSWLGDALV